VALVFILAGYLFGMVATFALLPRLAESAKGRLSFLVAANLVGAAVAVVTDEVWGAVRALTITNLGQAPTPISLSESVITTAARDIALYGGALMAMATIVYLLGPADHRN
jgi:hypothetical protein